MRPPKQTRSHRTLSRLANTALEILEKEGPDALTVAAVVGRAGVSVGSFYARFPGKEEFLVYLEGMRRAAARQGWEQVFQDPSWEGLSLAGAVHRVVAEMWQSGCRKGSAGQEGSDDPGREIILSFLAKWAREIAHPDPDVPLAVGYAMVRGAIKELPPQTGVDSGGGTGRESLVVDELARAWLAYLLAPPPPGSAPAPRPEAGSPSGAEQAETARATAAGGPARTVPNVLEEAVDYFDPWS